jgi:hypothetical protein
MVTVRGLDPYSRFFRDCSTHEHRGSRELARVAAIDLLHQSEIEHLDLIVQTAAHAEHQVRGLDVAIDQADPVRFGE